MEELARAGVPAMGYNDTFGIKMLGDTLLRWGTEAQKRRFLPRILSGEDRWCQGFSEPGSGSDLASLSTRAVLDGDHWVIDGQKVWTSRAREANWIFLLARTNPEARKHAGITFLLVDMRQPGVDVRPIRALSGESEFNEVFLTGATTPADHVVGEVDGGWAVASTLLGLERGEEAATNPILFRAELDRLVALARERGRTADPVVRQRLADAHVRCEIMRFLGLRILTGVLAGDGTLGPEASISKLYWSEYHRHVTELALDVLGGRGHGRRRAGTAARLPHRRPGRPQHDRLVARRLLQRHRRHDLRRHVRGAAQHHRRDRARAPEVGLAAQPFLQLDRPPEGPIQLQTPSAGQLVGEAGAFARDAHAHQALGERLLGDVADHGDVGEIDLAAPPGAVGSGEGALARGDREELHGEGDGGDAAAEVEVVAGRHRATAGGVDERRDDAAVEDAVVGAEVIGERDVHLDAIRIPPPNGHPAMSVEQDAVLPVLPEPGPASLLFLLCE